MDAVTYIFLYNQFMPIVRQSFADAVGDEGAKFLKDHFSEGMPGFYQFLSSERFKSVLEYLYSEYREFLATGK